MDVKGGEPVADLEKLVKATVLQPPDYKRLGVLFLARTNAPNAEILNHIINGVAAGLTAVYKGDVYTQRIRPFVADPMTLEGSLNVPCARCAGEGTQTCKCAACGGNGVCKNTGCANGVTVRPVMNGGNVEGPCVVCKGTGRCPKCDGTGNKAVACSACLGKKAVFSPNKAAAVYADEMQAAVKCYDALRDESVRQSELAEADRVAKAEAEHQKEIAKAQAAALMQAEVEERKTAAEHTRKLRQAEVEGRKVAAVAEGEALGKERARLAVEEERRRADEEREKKQAERDRQYLPLIVLIEGEHGVGTGFFCEFKGKKVVFSNAHVLCGNLNPVIRTVTGESVRYKRIYVCKVRDVVIYELADTKSHGALVLYDGSRVLNNQEEVVVFGNSGGGGVVTTLRGKMQGIGPDKIEVDATFISGNSGSPIIAYDYGKVVGMATYVQNQGKVDWVTRKTRFEDIRRFGVRVDNLSWSDFEALDVGAYEGHLETVKLIKGFAGDVMAAADDGNGRYMPPEHVTRKAQQMLVKYEGLPKWMREYSEDAQVAALVCKVVLGLIK